MRAFLLMVFLATACPAAALAAEPDDPAAKVDAVDNADADAETRAAEPAGDKEFVPPPGYQKMKRGKHELWCRKETEIGTRFSTIKCYTDEQLRALVELREKQNRDFDQRRSVCSNPAVCSVQ